MYWYMAMAVFVSFWVKGISGFANSLIFGSIMSFRTNTINITPMDLLLNVPANFYFMWKERKKIKLGVVVPLSLLMLAGAIPGVLWLSVGDVVTIKILFGFVVMAIAIEMYLRERNPKKSKSSPVLLFVIGLVAGVCAGLFGISAMLAAYVTRTTDDMEAFRGNICAVFFVDNLFRFVLYMSTGIMTLDSLTLAVTLAPFMVLGLGTGVFFTRFISEKTVKNIVVIGLMLSGISLIVTNLALM